MTDKKVNAFKCPCCSQWLPVKKDKSDNPYIVCSECGVQMFVRYQKGIERFYSQVIQKPFDETLH